MTGSAGFVTSKLPSRATRTPRRSTISWTVKLTETDPDFPTPAETLARGRVWHRGDIVEWGRVTGREILEPSP